MIPSPRKGAPRRPLLGIAAVIVVAVLLWLQRPAPTPPATAPGTPAAAPASPATTTPEVAADAGFGEDVGFRSRERWREHWDKHGREFASLGITDAEGYLLAAQRLRDRPAGGDVLEVTRGDGVTTRFERSTGAFLAFNRDGTIRTFFRPNDGERYFRRQAEREH